MLPIKDDQPRYSTPSVTWFLIALNLMIYLVRGDAGPTKPAHAGTHLWRGAVASVGIFGGVSEIHAAGGRASLLHLDVPARFVDARDRQYVVSLYFRRQRRRLSGTFQIPGLLHFDRIDCDDHPGIDFSALGIAGGGSERRDRGRAGSVFCALSASPGADLVFCVCAVDSGMDHARLLVCA